MQRARDAIRTVPAKRAEETLGRKPHDLDGTRGVTINGLFNVKDHSSHRDRQ